MIGTSQSNQVDVDIIYNDLKPWRVYLFCGGLQGMLNTVNGDGKYSKHLRRWGKVGNGGGYTSLDDVTQIPPPKRDSMESFWLVSHTFGGF